MRDQGYSLLLPSTESAYGEIEENLPQHSGVCFEPDDVPNIDRNIVIPREDKDRSSDFQFAHVAFHRLVAHIYFFSNPDMYRDSDWPRYSASFSHLPRIEFSYVIRDSEESLETKDERALPGESHHLAHARLSVVNAVEDK
jgi:hypothetical protein